MIKFKSGAAALAVLMAMPHMAAAQDDFTIKLGGRLHVDYATGDAVSYTHLTLPTTPYV